jgi:hypothetical protein
LGRGRGNRIGEQCQQVRLGQDRVPILANSPQLLTSSLNNSGSIHDKEELLTVLKSFKKLRNSELL